jgi:subtilisin family serine protease
LKKRSKLFLLLTSTILMASYQNVWGATESPAPEHRLNPVKGVRVGERLLNVESEHLLVKFKDNVSLDRQDQILAAHKSARVENIGQGKLGALHRVHVPPGQEQETLARLKESAEVEFAEYNESVPAVATSNDPMLGNQWHLANISTQQAWDISRGTNPVTIAILDTGVNINHPDLINRVVPGYNIYNNNTDVTDIQGHGTAVAGTAIVDTNNGIGLASPCWSCKLMPVRIAYLDSSGGAYALYSTMASGMTWASDHGAKLINCSYVSMNNSSTVGSAATYVKSHGGIVFGSLGNDNQLMTTNLAPDLIFVGSTNSSNQKSSFSNYGPVMSLSAPGEYISTTDRGGGYSTWQGTSFASPLVAGVAALVWSTNPTLTESQVRSILFNSADDLGAAGKDDQFGYGKVNAYKAVQLAVNGSPSPAPAPAPTTTTTTSTTTTMLVQPASDSIAPSISILSPSAGATVSRSVSVSVKASDNVGVSKVALYVDGSLVGTSTSAPFTINWNTKKTAVGSHNISVKAWDAAGNVGSSATVTVNVAR